MNYKNYIYKDKKNYLKIKNEYNVTEDNIFIVGSSGVAMAKNTQELIDKVKLFSESRQLYFYSASMAKP